MCYACVVGHLCVLSLCLCVLLCVCMMCECVCLSASAISCARYVGMWGMSGKVVGDGSGELMGWIHPEKNPHGSSGRGDET